MPKEFYTEKDIEDLYKSGVRSLQVTQNVVLTELAYEKAKRLDLQLITAHADNPPAAPVRPYLSEPQMQPAPRSTPIAAPVAPAVVHTQPALTPALSQRENEVEKRIRAAVIARLGNQVDSKLLDSIIHRVVKGVGLK